MVDFATLVLASTAFIVGFISLVYLNRKRFRELVIRLSGGDSIRFSSDEYILQEMAKKWEATGKSTYAFSNAVVVCDPEIAQVILEETTKTSIYHSISSGLSGERLDISNDETRTNRRKMIGPFFHNNKLEHLYHVFNHKASVLTDRLSKKVGRIVDVFDYVTGFTSNVISETTLGLDLGTQSEAGSEYWDAISKILDISYKKTHYFWKRFKFFYMLSSDYRAEKKSLKTVTEFLKKVVVSKKVEAINNIDGNFNEKIIMKQMIHLKKDSTFLDFLLTGNKINGLADKDLLNEVNLMLLAGHDTIATCLSFTIYSIANDPKVQALALQEQLQIFGDDPTRDPTYTELQSMYYLGRVIKETLRLYPPMPIMSRVNSNDIVFPDAKIIPKETFIMVNIYQMSRNPKYFADPLKFDPDRFLPEHINGRHPYLYIPFGGGPRNCIGQKFAMLEVRAALSKIIRRFEIRSAGPKYAADLLPILTLKSKNGLNVVLKERESYKVFTNNDLN